ncbi:MAG TPA: cyclic nucleotide-binding domain-containing protein [candidate division Zixibacteria bacterium]|nr:cyclic nucleotide-binding domain-containing protein [candidate division Zixibacteria bacterium]
MDRDIERAAAAIPLLASLKPKDRQQVLRSARQRQYAPGETVVREGDPATHLYAIVSGTARVERAESGTVGHLKAGDFFGELGLIEEHGRTATVVADDDLTCLLIPAWEFRATLEAHPEMAVPMLYAIIARLHASEHHGTGG